VTKLRIDPGNCMIEATVTVRKKSNLEVDVFLETTCRNLCGFKEKYRTVSVRTYPEMMRECIPHCICPVPLGVLKACETEFGLGLRKDVKYEFVRE